MIIMFIISDGYHVAVPKHAFTSLSLRVRVSHWRLTRPVGLGKVHGPVHGRACWQ